ncbi:MAG TPA: hypothetical protein VF610_11185 [Segetibacter sp.]|jgi:hypothetical protein
MLTWLGYGDVDEMSRVTHQRLINRSIGGGDTGDGVVRKGCATYIYLKKAEKTT